MRFGEGLLTCVLSVQAGLEQIIELENESPTVLKERKEARHIPTKKKYQVLQPLHTSYYTRHTHLRYVQMIPSPEVGSGVDVRQTASYEYACHIFCCTNKKICARTLDVLECKYTQPVELSSVGSDREIERDACPGADWATICGWSIAPLTY